MPNPAVNPRSSFTKCRPKARFAYISLTCVIHFSHILFLLSVRTVHTKVRQSLETCCLYTFKYKVRGLQRYVFVHSRIQIIQQINEQIKRDGEAACVRNISEWYSQCKSVVVFPVITTVSPRGWVYQLFDIKQLCIRTHINSDIT